MLCACLEKSKAVAKRSSIRTVFLEILPNYQENISAGVFYLIKAEGLQIY